MEKNDEWLNLTDANGWVGTATATVGYNPTAYDASIQAIRCVATTTLKDTKSAATSTATVPSNEAPVWGIYSLTSFRPEITTNLTRLSDLTTLLFQGTQLRIWPIETKITIYMYIYILICYNAYRGGKYMVTEAQKRATQKYVKNNIKRIPLDVSKKEYEIIKDAAEKLDMSVNGFIKATVLDKIDDLSGYLNNQF